jgi:hypothetical protein
MAAKWRGCRRPSPQPSFSSQLAAIIKRGRSTAICSATPANFRGKTGPNGRVEYPGKETFFFARPLGGVILLPAPSLVRCLMHGSTSPNWLLE